MNRRSFMKLAAAIGVPWWTNKSITPKEESPWHKYSINCLCPDCVVIRETANSLTVGYIIIEDSGTFGMLTNGYRFKLAVREINELVETSHTYLEQRGDVVSSLEGRFLCEPPKTWNDEQREIFPIESPSLTCRLRLFDDGTFKSNGPYVVSEEVAERLRGLR